MENEGLDLAYINYDKCIMHGQILEDAGWQYDVGHRVFKEVQIEQVLTQEQKDQVYDLNEKHQREMLKLLRSFVQ